MKNQKAYYRFCDNFVKTYPLGSWEHEVQFIEALSRPDLANLIENCSIYTNHYKNKKDPATPKYELLRLAFQADLRSSHHKLNKVKK